MRGVLCALLLGASAFAQTTVINGPGGGGVDLSGVRDASALSKQSGVIGDVANSSVVYGDTGHGNGGISFAPFINTPLGGIGPFQNLLAWSECFDCGVWTNTDISVGFSDRSPFGDANGNETLTSTADGAYSSQVVSAANTDGGTYIFSLWLHAISSPTLNARLVVLSQPSGAVLVSTVQALTTTWKRCFVKAVSSVALDTDIEVRIVPVDAGQGEVGGYGAQLEYAGGNYSSDFPSVYASTNADPVVAINGNKFLHQYGISGGGYLNFFHSLNRFELGDDFDGYTNIIHSNTQIVNGLLGVDLHTPASSSEICTAGQFSDGVDSGTYYHYLCVTANVWQRFAYSSF